MLKQPQKNLSNIKEDIKNGTEMLELKKYNNQNKTQKQNGEHGGKNEWT